MSVCRMVRVAAIVVAGIVGAIVPVFLAGA